MTYSFTGNAPSSGDGDYNTVKEEREDLCVEDGVNKVFVYELVLFKICHLSVPRFL